MGFVSPDSSVTVSDPAKQAFKEEPEPPEEELPEEDFCAVAAIVFERY
jgi:hypothetical protein